MLTAEAPGFREYVRKGMPGAVKNGSARYRLHIARNGIPLAATGERHAGVERAKHPADVHQRHNHKSRRGAVRFTNHARKREDRGPSGGVSGQNGRLSIRLLEGETVRIR